MIGLKIAGVSLVLFVTGLILNEALRRGDNYKMPDAIGWLGVAGVIGVPLGLILAIIGV